MTDNSRGDPTALLDPARPLRDCTGLRQRVADVERKIALALPPLTALVILLSHESNLEQKQNMHNRGCSRERFVAPHRLPAGLSRPDVAPDAY